MASVGSNLCVGYTLIFLFIFILMYYYLDFKSVPHTYYPKVQFSAMVFQLDS